MRVAARTDANQKEVVKAFRDLGYKVVLTFQLGSGFPDIVIIRLLPSKHRFTALLEIYGNLKIFKYVKIVNKKISPHILQRLFFL